MLLGQFVIAFYSHIHMFQIFLVYLYTVIMLAAHNLSIVFVLCDVPKSFNIICDAFILLLNNYLSASVLD
jgi:hypothetical protein